MAELCLTKFPPLKIERKSGEEHFRHQGRKLQHRLDDFWKWAVSDLVSNATRGILAEFIVASAFGEVTGVRKEWDAYDLKLPDGTKVEVKSSAYCQSWGQNDYSRPEFSIRSTHGWDSETNIVSSDLKRQADIYVFCLFNEKDRESLDPMDLDKWSFYLVSAAILNERCPTQKKIGLNSLLKLNPKLVNYSGIATGVKELAEQIKKVDFR